MSLAETQAAAGLRTPIRHQLFIDGRFVDAARAYDAAVDRSQALPGLPISLDPTVCALSHKASALALDGSVTSAIQTFSDMGRFPSRAKQAFLQAGLLAEKSGDLIRAADLYSRTAATSPSPRTDDAAQLCRRALLRMQDAAALYFANQYQLRDALISSLEYGDAELEQPPSPALSINEPVSANTEPPPSSIPSNQPYLNIATYVTCVFFLFWC